MDVNAHALSVDITDLKVQAFTQSEAAGVHGGQIGLVLRGIDGVEDARYSQ